MATYEKRKLSGAGTTNEPIPVTGSDSTGYTTLHQTGTSSTVLDEIWIYAYESSGLTTTECRLEIASGEIFRGVLEPYGTLLICAGIPISGTGSAVSEVQGWGSNGVVNFYGYVNRITP